MLDRSRHALFIFGLCIAGSALLPALSQAAPEGDATIKTDTFTVAPFGTEDGQAFCPPGTRVVGGGVTGVSGGDSDVRVSGPLDETGLTPNLADGDVGRSWYANLKNETGSPETFVSTALCSAGSDATIRVDPFTVPAGGEEDGQAFCPTGSRVIGGGVTGSSPGNIFVRVSGPLDETGLTPNLANGDVGRSWYAKVATSAGGSFVSTAICSPASDATIRVDPFALPGDSTGQASCPANTRVVGGGVTGSGGANSTVQVSGPLDDTGLTSNLADGDIGRSWFTSIFNPAASSYVSTAICAPPTSTTAGAVQKCKGKTATIAARPGAFGRKFTGTPSNDVIVGTAKKDKINAGKGNDLVCAGGGKDTVKGGAGKDKLFGESGNDKLFGQGGKDLLSGGPGKKDSCSGGPGKDQEKSC